MDEFRVGMEVVVKVGLGVKVEFGEVMDSRGGARDREEVGLNVELSFRG